MKVNGIELLQMIKDGKIKEGTKVKYLCENLIVIDECLAYENPWGEVGCSLITSDDYFEITEEITEDKPIQQLKTCSGENYSDDKSLIVNKINELVDEINELKKESDK